MRHPPRELLKVGKSDRGEQKSTPILILGFPMKYSEICKKFWCGRRAEYALGRKDGVSVGSLNGTMKFDKIRAVEEHRVNLVRRMVS